MATAALVFQPWRGAVVLAFSSNQGIDLGDVPPILLAVAAVALLAGVPALAPIHAGVDRLRSTPLGQPRIAAASAGVVLMAAGLLQLYEHAKQERVVAAAVSLAAVGALIWFVVVIGRTALVPAGCFLLGAVGDAIATPSGTLFAPMLLALSLAVAQRGVARVALILTAAGCAALSVASLNDLAGIDVRMAGGEGGPARAAALGGVLLLWAVAPAASTPGRR